MGAIARQDPDAVAGSADPGPREAVVAGFEKTLHAEVVGGRLTLSGRLDGRSAAVLHDAVSSLLRAGQSSWSVDATRLVVGDHAGLRAFVGCYQRALRHDCLVTVHGASPALRYALGRLRLDVHLLPDEGTGSARSGPAADRGPVATT